jgi:hypothetical protein
LAESAYQRSLSFRYERFANDVQALLTDIGADM